MSSHPLQGISIGCQGRGVRHGDEVPDVDTLFAMVRDGVFDHFDRLPQPGEESAYLRAAEKHGIPIRTGSVVYRAGGSLGDLEKNLRVAKGAGGEYHNVLLNTTDVTGHVLLKLDSAEEQDASGIREDVENGSLVLDPFEPGNVFDQWLSMNMVPWPSLAPGALERGGEQSAQAPRDRPG